MAGFNELLVDALTRDVQFLNHTVADMTDSELAQRPVHNANNALWQLGHLISAEAGMVNGCAGTTLIELPAGFAERYKKENSSVNDPAKLGTKVDLLDQFAKGREKTCKWIAGLSPADLAKPTPEKMRAWCPTNGHLAFTLGDHLAMHIGQIQVLRRKLGKPILF
jgi:hypothetical protein